MFRFAHVSDSHVRPDDGARSRVFVEHLRAAASQEADFVIHTGDLMDEPSEWAARAFRTLVSGLAVPLHPVPGNHDVYNPPMADLEAPWWARLSVDSKLEGQYRGWFGPSWYGFSHEGTRFLALNSLVINSGLPEEGAQWNWMEAELDGAAERGEVIVIFTHLPLFARHPDEQLDATDFRNRYLVVAPPGRDRLLELICRHRVLAVLSGHIHVPRQVTHTWPGDFTTHFVGTGSSGCLSPMAVEHFDLPVEPEEGLGFHTHYIDGGRFSSEYHRYVPAPGGRWHLGASWSLHLPSGQEPPLQEGLTWKDPGYRPTVPPWEVRSAPKDLDYRPASGLVGFYIQEFEAQSRGVALTLELATRDAGAVYLNGVLQYAVAAMSERPGRWRSAGGTYAIDGPSLSLPLTTRSIRKGINVLAIRLDGAVGGKTEVALRRQRDAMEVSPCVS